MGYIKRIIILFTLVFSITIILSLPFVSAVEVDIKNEYSQGETLLAKFSGSFVDPILKDNVFFYRGHVQVPFNYDIAKINDDFYVYALLPENTGNYSLVIKNVQYNKATKIVDDEIWLNFTISNNTADFSVNPGFIITKEPFSLKVQNLQDKKVDIVINTGSEESTVSLKPGESKIYKLPALIH